MKKVRNWDGDTSYGSEYSMLRQDFQFTHKQAITVIEYGWASLPPKELRKQVVNFFKQKKGGSDVGRTE